MNILINHPDFQDPGGVSAYYRQLESKFRVSVTHFILGRRPKERGFCSKTRRMILDYLNFIKLIKRQPFDIIHLNPSLDPKSFFRDGIYAMLASCLGKKVIVFIHGWQKSFELRIEQNYKWLFGLMYGKVSCFIVLANDFKEKLAKWGFVQPIFVDSTVIDDDFLHEFAINRAIEDRQKSERWRILFLSRILKAKGIYETVQAFSLLRSKYPAMELMVAGDGEELGNVRKLVEEHKIPDVNFVGYVSGNDKRRLLELAHVYCLPSHGEGMPGSIIEAMAFGLPIVTTPVGGIRDLIKNGQHGFLSANKKTNEIAYSIEQLFQDKQLYKKISLYNFHYARSNFLASKAARRLERIYTEVIR